MPKRKILDAAMVLLLPLLMAYSHCTVSSASLVQSCMVEEPVQREIFAAALFSDGVKPVAVAIHDLPTAVWDSHEQAPVYLSAD